MMAKSYISQRPARLAAARVKRLSNKNLKRKKMTKEKDEAIRYSSWLNLFIGIYNMYLYSQGDWWFNLLIGTLNIGVWVFFIKV